MIAFEQAMGLARTELTRMQIPQIADLELDPFEGGWQVRWIVEPLRPLLLGVRHIIISVDGTVHHFPSWVSPRMALELFHL